MPLKMLLHAAGDGSFVMFRANATLHQDWLNRIWSFAEVRCCMLGLHKFCRISVNIK